MCELCWSYFRNCKQINRKIISCIIIVWSIVIFWYPIRSLRKQMNDLCNIHCMNTKYVVYNIHTTEKLCSQNGWITKSIDKTLDRYNEELNHPFINLILCTLNNYLKLLIQMNYRLNQQSCCAKRLFSKWNLICVHMCLLNALWIMSYCGKCKCTHAKLTLTTEELIEWYFTAHMASFNDLTVNRSHMLPEHLIWNQLFSFSYNHRHKLKSDQFSYTSSWKVM